MIGHHWPILLARDHSRCAAVCQVVCRANFARNRLSYSSQIRYALAAPEPPRIDSQRVYASSFKKRLSPRKRGSSVYNGTLESMNVAYPPQARIIHHHVSW